MWGKGFKNVGKFITPAKELVLTIKKDLHAVKIGKRYPDNNKHKVLLL